MMFKDRIEAGEKLAEKITRELDIKILETRKLRDEFVILGVPRGGVVVAKKVAEKLGCPLDIIVTRKIGAPGNPELAIGAVGETEGSHYIDERLVADVGADQEYLQKEIENQKKEIKRREELYRAGKTALDLSGKTVVLVDDGVATGATMIAAVREVWNNNPEKVIVGLPVASKDAVDKLKDEADQVIVLETPWPFFAVGQFYQNFSQVGDNGVVELLNNYKKASNDKKKNKKNFE